jgi:hypothetical protein
MPTADEYELGAARFESIADDVERAPGPVRAVFDEGVLVGGALTAAIQALIETDEATCRYCAAELRDLAAECRRRAEICRAYEADLAAHRAAVRRHGDHMDRWEVARARWLDDPDRIGPPGAPPRAPVAPERPAPWVET